VQRKSGVNIGGEAGMIKVIMFDLGFTLVDSSTLRPFPHVEAALTEISGLTAKDGKPIQSCLVSDFGPDGPATDKQMAEAFKAFCDKLDMTGLRHFFEPVERRVTLSVQAGAPKPDRKIFDLALSRLGADGSLKDVSLKSCLLITEDPGHIAAARTQLGMAALQFRKAGATEFDFDDWLQAPDLIRGVIAAR
jgi:FMN phosphatase YigB (HAD superfamily)